MPRISAGETVLATLASLALAASLLWVSPLTATAQPLTLAPKHLLKRDFTIANNVEPLAWRCDPRRHPEAIFAGICETKVDPMGVFDAHYQRKEPVAW